MAQLNDLVGQNSGGLSDRIAALGNSSDAKAAGEDLIKQLTDLQSQQADLQKAQNDVPSGASQLGSVGGILSLLAAAGGVASGDPSAAEAGVGALGGFLGAKDSQAAQEKASLQATQATLAKTLESNRQRLTTMITTRPELFVDAETGQSLIDGRLLAFASTGFMIPIDPGINMKLQKQTQRTKDKVELFTEVMKNGETPAARQVGVVGLNNTLKLDFTVEEVDALADMDQTAAWSTLLARPGLNVTHTLTAWQFATENNLPIMDPQVISLLEGDPSRGADGSKFTLDDRRQSLIVTMNQALAKLDPAVYQDLGWSERIDLVFGGKAEGDAQLLKKFFAVDDILGIGVTNDQFFDTVNSVGLKLINLWKSTQGKFPIFIDNNITTEDEVWGLAMKMTSGSIPAIQRGNKEAAARQAGNAQRRITEAYQAANPEASEADAAAEGAITISKLREKATTSSGLLVGSKFQELVAQWLLDNTKE